jgi:hypothetical protein
MKELSATFGKGIVYALCFWFVYKGLNLLWQPVTQSSAATQQQIAAETTYLRQQERASQLLDESEKQHKRMSAIIALQEENAQRLKTLLDLVEVKGKK